MRLTELKVSASFINFKELWCMWPGWCYDFEMITVTDLCLVQCLEFGFERGWASFAAGHILDSAVLQLVAGYGRLSALVPLLSHFGVLGLGWKLVTSSELTFWEDFTNVTILDSLHHRFRLDPTIAVTDVSTRASLYSYTCNLVIGKPESEVPSRNPKLCTNKKVFE